MNGVDIPGYTYGTDTVAKSPVTPEELAKLEQAVGLTDEDRRYLRLAGDVLEDQAEAVVDCWRGIIAQQPHLAFYSTGPDADSHKAGGRRRLAAPGCRKVRWVSCPRNDDRPEEYRARCSAQLATGSHL